MNLRNVGWVALLGAWALGCGTRSTANTLGTESHFLMECKTSSVCGKDLGCFGGRCTKSCDSDDECSALSPDSACVGDANGSGSSCDLECNSEDDCGSVESATCSGDVCRVSHGGSDAPTPSDDMAGDPSVGSDDDSDVSSDGEDEVEDAGAVSAGGTSGGGSGGAELGGSGGTDQGGAGLGGSGSTAQGGAGGAGLGGSSSTAQGGAGLGGSGSTAQGGAGGAGLGGSGSTAQGGAGLGGSGSTSQGGAGLGGSASNSAVVDQVIAECALPVSGEPMVQEMELPEELTDANWGLKADTCERSGWDLDACAGTTATFTSFAAEGAEPSDISTIWIVTLGDEVCCVYGSGENALPGIYDVSCN